MTSYIGRNREAAQIQQENREDHDFSINNEDVSENIDQLTGSFENFKKTVSCGTVYDTIKQFEEINKRLDR